MVHWAKSVIDLVGHTPLVELERFKAAAGGTVATLLAKLEMFNPGGSNKDRVALQMVCEAEAQGLLRPGSTIIEPTSGNTGIGLAFVSAWLSIAIYVVVAAMWLIPDRRIETMLREK